jgi:hypothetical protein
MGSGRGDRTQEPPTGAPLLVTVWTRASLAHRGVDQRRGLLTPCRWMEYRPLSQRSCRRARSSFLPRPPTHPRWERSRYRQPTRQRDGARSAVINIRSPDTALVRTSRVAGAAHSLVSHMSRLVSHCVQAIADPRGQVLIEQESHAGGRSG